MNDNKEDIGVLSGYTLDLAFGSDENNFECELAKNNHCCESGYFLYIEGTEYGGVIDKIEVSTDSEYVIYKGRTWHGMMANKVVCPDAGYDYLTLDGEANSVLAELIKRVGLDGIFKASSVDSEIEISSYDMNRYIDLYSGIRKMLQTFGAKLKVEFVNGFVVLSAVPFADYSQDEEFDQSEVSFTVEKKYKVINHLICLGSGDLKDRHVIHLFTDENGGIQPYATKEEPLEDSDYILDTSQQLLFGNDELCETYDLGNAETTENYILLKSEPDDFTSNYSAYYEIDEESESFEELKDKEETIYALQTEQPDDWKKKFKEYFIKSRNEYKKVESISEDVYTLLSGFPVDWYINPGKYYYKDGSKYKKVEKEEKVKYNLQTKKPVDWKKNYKNYYVYNSDGVESSYVSVNGVGRKRYEVQTEQPTDWNENFTNYYVKMNVVRNGTMYRQLKKSEGNKAWIPTWKKDTFYTQYSYNVAPVWEKNMYYTCRKYNVAPQFAENKYYSKTVVTIPEWESGKYYTEIKYTAIPQWHTGTYYRKAYDNYASLVQGGIEKLEEIYQCDKIEVEFDTDKIYDIGDIVGAREETTGISVWQPITKKIINIQDDDVNINYKVGD